MGCARFSSLWFLSAFSSTSSSRDVSDVPSPAVKFPHSFRETAKFQVYFADFDDRRPELFRSSLFLSLFLSGFLFSGNNLAGKRSAPKATGFSWDWVSRLLRCWRSNQPPSTFNRETGGVVKKTKRHWKTDSSINLTTCNVIKNGLLICLFCFCMTPSPLKRMKDIIFLQGQRIEKIITVGFCGRNRKFCQIFSSWLGNRITPHILS